MIINGNLNLANSKIQSLGNLRKVEGLLDLTDCENLEDLGDLEEIGEQLILTGCKNLKSPGKLKNLDKVNFNVANLGFENLGLIKDISLGMLYQLRNLKSFGNLKRIYKTTNEWYHLYQIPENLEKFSNIDSFDFDLQVFFPTVKKLKSLNPIKIINGNLQIGGYNKVSKNQFNDISSIEYIQGDLDLYYYPNDILKINQNLTVGKNIFINSETNPNCYRNFPIKLKLKLTDKWEHELKKKGKK